MIKVSAKNQKSSDVYSQLSDGNLNESINFPRDFKQIQNFTTNISKKVEQIPKSKNVADELLNIIRILQEKQPYVVVGVDRTSISGNVL